MVPEAWLELSVPDESPDPQPATAMTAVAASTHWTRLNVIGQ